MTTLNKITEQNNFQERNFLNLLPRPFSTIRLEKFFVPTFELLYLWRSGREPHVRRVSHRYQVGHHSWPLLRRVRTIYYFFIGVNLLYDCTVLYYTKELSVFPHRCCPAMSPHQGACRTEIRNRDLTCRAAVRCATNELRHMHPNELHHTPMIYDTHQWATSQTIPMSYATPNEPHHTQMTYITPRMSYATPSWVSVTRVIFVIKSLKNWTKKEEISELAFSNEKCCMQ
jgi:hypothetical protein